MSPAPPAEQFWLMTGDTPAGPFTVAQVHGEIAAGRATWRTPACPIGGKVWLPLMHMPGVGPAAGTGPPVARLDERDTVHAMTWKTLWQHPAIARTRRLYAERPGLLALGSIAVLIVGLYLAAKGISLFAGGRAPNVFAADMHQNAVSSPATEPKETNYSGWNLATEPRIPMSMQDPTELLVGSWRFRDAGAYSSTFRFESDGSFTYYVSGSNAFINWPVANVEAYGRWSVRDGTLFVEFTGANKEAMLPLFRGLTGRSPISFTSANVVKLSGVEGDPVTRSYVRVR